MPRNLAWSTALLVLALFASSLQAAPAPAPRVRGEGPLSARLTALAASPALLADSAGLADTLSLRADGPGSLLTSAAGEVLVYIQTGAPDAATLAGLASAGARVTHVSAAYGVVTAYVRPAALRAVGRVPAVRAMVEALAPRTEGIGARPAAAGPAQADCPGAFTSEGDGQLRAAQARATYGVDGAGVIVGILSDSYDLDELTPINAAEDIARGDLPGPGNPCGRAQPVAVVEESVSGGNDEGRAMAQIVHDLAPGARLAFASAFNGLFAFADNIRRLRSEAGAAIIVDDVSYFEEPLFQDGPVSVAISDVTGAGALYFTAAGNAHVVDAANQPIGSYEADAYRPGPCPAVTEDGVAFELGLDCHDFDPGAATDTSLEATLESLANLSVQLHWSEPWFGVRNDLDLYLVDAAGELLGSGATGHTFTPFESASAGGATTVRIVVARFSGEAAQLRLKLLLSGHTGLEYAGTATGDRFGPTVSDHSMAADAISVAAAPYDDGRLPEGSSSRGPATVYWGPSLSITAAEPLAQPQTRNKPDLAATNGGQTSFFFAADPDCTPGLPGSICRFFGTSAAAPHAAAVAALMRERAAGRGALLTQELARELLIATAAPMGATPQARGAGLVDALRAVGAVDALDGMVYLPVLQR